MEQVQYRAGKIISGAIHRTSRELVYQELGWDTLAERRKKQRIKTFHKMVNGKAPTYLQEEIPDVNPNRENLRNESNIPKIRGMVFYEKTFIPKTIDDWNNLDDEIKPVESYNTFADKITRKIETPIWYLIGERTTNMWHARMRMKCSPLNDDLHSHIHVVDTPGCSCGYRRETSKHFLLDCPLYTDERDAMLSELALLGFKPLVKNLLFGDTTYSVETNCKAFTIIQNYLKSTKRFCS